MSRMFSNKKAFFVAHMTSHASIGTNVSKFQVLLALNRKLVARK